MVSEDFIKAVRKVSERPNWTTNSYIHVRMCACNIITYVDMTQWTFPRECDFTSGGGKSTRYLELPPL